MYINIEYAPLVYIICVQVTLICECCLCVYEHVVYMQCACMFGCKCAYIRVGGWICACLLSLCLCMHVRMCTMHACLAIKLIHVPCICADNYIYKQAVKPDRDESFSPTLPLILYYNVRTLKYSLQYSSFPPT